MRPLNRVIMRLNHIDYLVNSNLMPPISNQYRPLENQELHLQKGVDSLYNGTTLQANILKREGDLLEDILNKIVDIIQPHHNRMLIGISGHGAAGKTFFAEQLEKRFKQPVNYLNTDPYIVTGVRHYTSIQYDHQDLTYAAKMTACHPLAHNLSALKRDIQMIRDGMDFYTIETDYMASTLIRSSQAINLIEGMSVAFIEPNVFDLSVYLYCDSETELSRRGIRDVTERGVELTALKESHQQRRIQYQQFMHPYHEHFDIVINTSNDHFLVEKFAVD